MYPFYSLNIFNRKIISNRNILIVITYNHSKYDLLLYNYSYFKSKKIIETRGYALQLYQNSDRYGPSAIVDGIIIYKLYITEHRDDRYLVNFYI